MGLSLIKVLLCGCDMATPVWVTVCAKRDVYNANQVQHAPVSLFLLCLCPLIVTRSLS